MERIPLHCGFQVSLGPLLHHDTPWQALLKTSFQPQVLLVPTKSHSTEKAKRNQRLSGRPQSAPPQASSHHSPRPLCHQSIPPNSPLLQSSHFFWKARSSLGSKMFSSGSQLLCLERQGAGGGLVSSVQVGCPGQLPQPGWEQGALCREAVL